jgi:hypothetical protein
MRLGCAARGCGEAHEMLEVREEALHLAGISTQEAPRLHFIAEIVRVCNFYTPAVF